TPAPPAQSPLGQPTQTRPAPPHHEGTTMTTMPEQDAAPAAGATAVAVQTASSPTGASTGSVVGSMFGHFWPERESLRTAPLALLGSVAVGLLGAVILPERSFGIGTFLVLLAAGALVLWLSV